MILAIAQHLQVSPNQIIKIEEWANCYFVVIKGLGARFVSKKVVVSAPVQAPVIQSYQVNLSKECRKVRKSNHTLAGRRRRALFC
ncbi:MAG TPA: hypothetical protein V6D33_12070 [Cyanophyceae cyanobacterium]